METEASLLIETAEARQYFFKFLRFFLPLRWFSRRAAGRFRRAKRGYNAANGW